MSQEVVTSIDTDVLDDSIDLALLEREVHTVGLVLASKNFNINSQSDLVFGLCLGLLLFFFLLIRNNITFVSDFEVRWVNLFGIFSVMVVRIGLLFLGCFTFLLLQVDFTFHVSGINKVHDLLEAWKDVCNFCEELGLSGNGLVLVITNFKFFPLLKFSFTMFFRFFNINM